MGKSAFIRLQEQSKKKEKKKSPKNSTERGGKKWVFLEQENRNSQEHTE